MRSIPIRAVSGHYFPQHTQATEWLIFPCLSLVAEVDFWLLPLSLATAWILRQAGSTNDSPPAIPLTSFRKITLSSPNGRALEAEAGEAARPWLLNRNHRVVPDTSLAPGAVPGGSCMFADLPALMATFCYDD